jgi:hypothetical protein
MKYRPPDIVIGVLLTIAIFSLGMLFSPSGLLPINSSPQKQSGDQQPSTKITEDSNKSESLWVPTDSVGLYTLVLAVFTGLLVGVSGFQGYFLLRADKTARIAANAADLSARAAIALEMPVIRAAPHKFSYGSSLDGEGDNPRIEWCTIAHLNFSNVGRTQAFPIELRCGWTAGDKLPDVPVYTLAISFPLNLILEPKSEEPSQLHIHNFDLTFGPGLYDRVRDNTVGLWFYCSVVYLDFMQTRHEAGFCWKRYEIFGGGGFLPDPTPTYNQKT